MKVFTASPCTGTGSLLAGLLTFLLACLLACWLALLAYMLCLLCLRRFAYLLACLLACMLTCKPHTVCFLHLVYILECLGALSGSVFDAWWRSVAPLSPILETLAYPRTHRARLLLHGCVCDCAFVLCCVRVYINTCVNVRWSCLHVWFYPVCKPNHPSARLFPTHKHVFAPFNWLIKWLFAATPSLYIYIYIYAVLCCQVFGDVHGQLRDMLTLFGTFGMPGIAM